METATKECVKALRCVNGAHANFCPAYVMPHKPKDAGDPIVGIPPARTVPPVQEHLAKFDQGNGEARRDAGIDRAVKRKPELLATVRKAMVTLAQARSHKHISGFGLGPREVTADDAQGWLINNGYSESELGNAAGAIFRGCAEFTCTGRTVKSTRAKAQARRVMIWKLKAGSR